MIAIDRLTPGDLVCAVIAGEITAREAIAELKRREREHRPHAKQFTLTHLDASAPRDDDEK